MKEFYVYRLNMFLFELIRGLLIIVLGTFVLQAIPIIFMNITSLIIALSVFAIVGLITHIYMEEIKEKVGEYITQKVIESYCNKRGYSYQYDVIVKNDSNKTSKIDHIVITKKGIAVIETKYYTGKIYVSEQSENWTYDNLDKKSSKQKKYFHNPIIQNYGHVEALKKIVDKDIEYYNIVLFVDKVSFLKYQIINKFTKVGYIYELNSIIEKLDSLIKNKISSVEAYEIYNKIKDANKQEKELRKK